MAHISISTKMVADITSTAVLRAAVPTIRLKRPDNQRFFCPSSDGDNGSYFIGVDWRTDAELRVFWEDDKENIERTFRKLVDTSSLSLMYIRKFKLKGKTRFVEVNHRGRYVGKRWKKRIDRIR
jgi:hypothetical protein